jgi:hypothetical protein
MSYEVDEVNVLISDWGKQDAFGSLECESVDRNAHILREGIDDC